MEGFRANPLPDAFREKRFHFWFWPAAVLALAALCIDVVGMWSLRGAESVVLHASPVFGIDRIGPWWRALAPAAGAAGVLAVNTLVAGFFSRERKVIMLLLGIFTVVLEAGMAAASMVIVGLNR